MLGGIRWKSEFPICKVWDEIDEADRNELAGTYKFDCPRFSITEEARIKSKGW